MNIERWKMENGRLNIEHYLEGKQPLQPELTAMPTDEELEAAEMEFDRIIAPSRPPRGVSYWVGIVISAAAAVALAFVLWPQRAKETPSVPSTPAEPPALAINSSSEVSESRTLVEADSEEKDVVQPKLSPAKSLSSATGQRLAVAAATSASPATAAKDELQQGSAHKPSASHDNQAAALAAIEAETLAALYAVEAEAMQQAVEAQQQALATCSTPNQPS